MAGIQAANASNDKAPVAAEAEEVSDFDQYINDQAEIVAVPETEEEEEGTVVAPKTDEIKQAEAQPPVVEAEAQPLPTGQVPEPTLPEGIKRHASGAFSNKEGDITDHEGNLIAKNGFARRIYEQNQRASSRIEEQDKLISNLEGRLQEDTILRDSATRYGLSTQDTAQALDLAGRVKRGDVKSVARDIVSMLASQGHNVSDILGDDVGNSIDMQAVKQLLDQRLGPVHDQRKLDDENNERQLTAQREYTTFINNNQYANVQEAEVMAIVQSQNCTPQLAYNQLVGFAHKNQFNLTSPLGPQIEARNRQAAQGQPQVAQPNTQNRPIPSNGAVTHQQGGVQPQQQQYSSPDASWAEIIAEAQG